MDHDVLQAPQMTVIADAQGRTVHFGWQRTWCGREVDALTTVVFSRVTCRSCKRLLSWEESCVKRDVRGRFTRG